MNDHYEEPQNSRQERPYFSEYDAYRFRSPEELLRREAPPVQRERKPGGGLLTFFAVIGVVAILLTIGTAVYAALTGASLRSAVEAFFGESRGSEPEQEIVLGRQKETKEEQTLTVPEVVEQVMPSMVSLLTGESTAGSGVIVGENSEAYLIGTNAHVVKDRNGIRVTFHEGTAAEGTLLGSDPAADLAVVSVSKKGLPDSLRSTARVIEMGDSDALRTGETVIAIGNVLGNGQTVSQGVISGLNREVEDADGYVRTLIQTDASINPGISGGGLINMKGELIGISEAKYVSESVDGIGYAIPIATALPVLTKLSQQSLRETVPEDQASYIGITCMTVPEEYVKEGCPAGVYVLSLEEGGPAAKAGILEEDILVSLEGTSLKTQEELIDELTHYRAGEEVEVVLRRYAEETDSFEEVTLQVTLGNRKDMVISVESTVPEETTGSGAETEAEAEPEVEEGSEAKAEPEVEEGSEAEAESEAEPVPEAEPHSRIPGGRYREG